MGAYHCVIPVDWPSLRRVLDDWHAMLGGRLPAADVADRHWPTTRRRYDSDEEGDMLDEDRLQFRRETIAWVAERVRLLGPAYLAEIGCPTAIPDVLPAGHLRASRLHRRVSDSNDLWDFTYLLVECIRQSAAAHLGVDDDYARIPHGSFYARCHATGDPVAGTKTRFHFLQHVFETAWLRDEGEYAHTPRPDARADLTDLLAALFLSERAFPAAVCCRQSRRWPSGNDRRLPGYLTPPEVRLLANLLLDYPLLPPVDGDELFVLFDDRVSRAAAAGLGLVTLYEGL